MRRREFIMLLGGVVAGWPLPARAQRMEKMPQIGYLGVSSLSLEPHYIEAFRQKLRDLGHVEGKNIAIEYRWAEGQDDRLPNLASELVRLNPDVIVTTGTPGAVAAMQATKTIPIVMQRPCATRRIVKVVISGALASRAVGIASTHRLIDRKSTRLNSSH